MKALEHNIIQTHIDVCIDVLALCSFLATAFGLVDLAAQLCLVLLQGRTQCAVFLEVAEALWTCSQESEKERQKESQKESS